VLVAGDGGSLALAVERILGFLAQTGMTLLPWVAIAGALTLAGSLVLQRTRTRAVATLPGRSTQTALSIGGGAATGATPVTGSTGTSTTSRRGLAAEDLPWLVAASIACLFLGTLALRRPSRPE
jgi:LPXTG-motif cell wall-anchored protein